MSGYIQAWNSHDKTHLECITCYYILQWKQMLGHSRFLSCSQNNHETLFRESSTLQHQREKGTRFLEAKFSESELGWKYRLFVREGSEQCRCWEASTDTFTDSSGACRQVKIKTLLFHIKLRMLFKNVCKGTSVSKRYWGKYDSGHVCSIPPRWGRISRGKVLQNDSCDTRGVWWGRLGTSMECHEWILEQRKEMIYKT